MRRRDVRVPSIQDTKHASFFTRALILVVSTTMILGATGLPARAISNTTPFELDRNATKQTNDDWDNVLGWNATTHTQVPPTGTDIGHTFVNDYPTDTTYFTGGGSKDGNPISSWAYNSGGAQDKDQITNAYAAAYLVNNSIQLYFGDDRYSNTGNSTMGFWFLQNQIGTSGGKFTGAHKVGDILIVSDLPSTASNIKIFEWNGSGITDVTPTGGADCTSAPASAPICFTTNTSPTPAPWPYTPKMGTSGTFPAGSFLEGGVNLASLFPGTQAPCFASFLAESRSSNSPPATLSDFALGGINTCGEVNGQKFNDLNHNGAKNTGEPGLQGWTITAKDKGTNGSTFTTTATTDANGNYSLQSIPPGEYIICETQQSGWIQSFPAPGVSCSPGNGYDLTLTLGQIVNGKDFGNYQAQPSFTVSKTATPNPNPAVPGGSIHYVITVTNNGTGAGSTAVTDTYDSRLGPITNVTPNTGIVDTTAHTVTWTSGSIAPNGGTATFSFDAKIPTTFGSPPDDTTNCPGAYDIVNNVVVNGGASSTTHTCVSATPTFTVVKTATPNPNPAVPGGSIHYVITVTNNGSAPGSTTVTDTYDSRLSNITNVTPNTGSVDTTAHTVTWTSGSIAGGGGTAQFSFDATIPSTFGAPPDNTTNCPGAYDIVNNVVVNGGSSSTTHTCVGASPAFTVTKTATPNPNPAIPGGSIHYVITVTNNGTAPGSTTVTDTYDSRLTGITNITPATGVLNTGAHTVTWPSGTINPGNSATFSFDATIPSTFTGNPRTTAPCQGQYDIINDVALSVGTSTAHTDTCVTANPAFTVTKTATPNPNPAVPGGSIHYVITVTNNGSAPGSTVVTDTYDSRLGPITNVTPNTGAVDTTAHTVTWTSGSIAAGGGTATFSFDAAIPTTFTGPPDTTGPCVGQYDITNDVGLSVGISIAHTDTCVTANPAFTVTKSATPNPNPAVPGGSIHYVITVTNNGAAPGSTVVTDTYDSRLGPITNVTPASGVVNTTNHTVTWTSGTIAAGGGTATFSFDATIPSTFSGSPNTSPPCQGQFDLINDVALSVGTSTAHTDTCVTANPAFTVVKVATPNPNPAVPGGSIHYAITVTNNGPAAGSTPVTDTYDSRLGPITNVTPASGVVNTTNHTVTWTSGTIAGGGGTASFSFDATIPTTFTTPPDTTGPCQGGYDIINSVTVAGGSSSQTDTCVAANPSFSVVKTATPNPNPAVPGGSIHYVIVVTNNGAAPGSTTVTDTYDSRLGPITNVTPVSGVVDTTNHTVTWTSGSIAAGGGTATFSFDAHIPSTFTGPPNTTNPCAGSYDIINDVTVNGGSTSHTDTCVVANPSFSVNKVATPVPSPAVPGGSIHYVITVTNNGAAPGSTTVTDTYDSRLGPITNVTPTSGVVNTTNHTVTWTSGSIAAGGGTATFSFDAAIPSTFTGPPNTTNPCAGSYDIINDVTVNGGSTSHTDTCVVANPAFTVTKSATPNPNPAVPGGSIHYVITVTNNGAAPGSTVVTDTYDSRLGPITNVTPASGVVNTTNHTVTWTSGSIAAGGGTAQFSFDATIPTAFTGPPDSGGPCPGQFDIINNVALSVGSSTAHTDTCVPGNPHFVVSKVAKDSLGNTITSATPGQVITYVITVTNDGNAPGSTPVTDTYDSRLTNIGNITPNTGVNDSTAHTVTWASSGTILPGNSAQFSFTAQIPANFVGDPTSTGPCAGSFDIINNVGVTGNSAHNDLCVTATPNLSLAKTANKTGASGGDTITYTLTYSNTGSASSEATTITETIPANTSYASCTGGCATNGPPVTTVTWSIGSVAGHSSGSVTLTVNVLNTVGCQICNTASIQSRSFNGGVAVNSNTLCITTTPAANPAGAHASGNAFGLYVHEGILIPIDVTLSPTSSSQSGVGVDSHHASLLNTGVPGIVNVDLLSTTSNSTVSSTTNSADQLTTAETAGLNILNGLVTAQVVRAVASTHADGGSSSFSSIGSTIVGLQVNGVAYTNVTPGLTITLPKLVFGNGSYVKVYERTGSTSGPAAGQNSNGTYAADLTVNMIHVHITKLLLPLGGTALLDVNVSHATAHSDFPQTTVCTPVPKQSVSGHAFIAYENTDPSILPVLYGFVRIPSTGGHSSATLNTLNVPLNGSVLHTDVTNTDSNGSPGATSSNSTSLAQAANVCLLRTSPTACTIQATAVKSQASSTASAGGATSSDAGTQFVALQVLGVNIALPVAPNTVINLPGLGYVVLNEQFCDGAPTPTAPGPVAPCAGTTHSGITIRAIDVVLTVPVVNIGLRVIVAEAHSDATWIP